jgi:hypothetical protein
MIVFDFLFNVCYAPFHKAIKGGRLGALFTLTPSLTFVLTGIINLFFYKIFGRIGSILSPLTLSVGMLILFVSIYLLLDRIYVKNNREVAEMIYPGLYGLMLPIFFIGSIIFFVYTAGEFA